MNSKRWTIASLWFVFFTPRNYGRPTRLSACCTHLMPNFLNSRKGTRMPGFTTRPEIRGTFGVVATTHWIASAVGMSVLEKGGNAFDAAVAAGFTLQVVEPHLNGPGGEVPAVFFSVDRDEPLVLCGQGVAPAAATIERFRDLGHDLIPGTGVLAACVPGA